MDIGNFWIIVEDSLLVPREKEDSNEKLFQFLIRRLLCYEEDEIISYHCNYREILGAIRNRSIHQVGVIIEGYLNPDEFEWFCTWLIYKGKKIYTNVLKDPDSLADYIHVGEDTIDYEKIANVADKVFIQKRKNQALNVNELELPSKVNELVGLDLWESINVLYEDEELMTKYPKMWNKFRPEDDNSIVV